MTKPILLTAILAIYLFKDCTCIIGGRDAVPGAVPYQAAILVNDNLVCGGSLIAPKWILTAAACGWKQNVADIKVVLGTTNIEELEKHAEVRNVNTIETHPDFNCTSNSFNVALYELDKPVTYTNSIQAIALADENGVGGENLTNKEVVLNGWGKTGMFISQSKVLKQANLTIMANDICQNVLPYTEIRPSELCTKADMTSKRLGACTGDDGGPLVYNSKETEQIALVTRSLSFCTGMLPTVYTRVAPIKEWVRSHVGKDLKDTGDKDKEKEGLWSYVVTIFGK